MKLNDEDWERQYWQKLEEATSLSAVIFGLDPYPNGATGIAFSKITALPKNSSGYRLLRSLGERNPANAHPKTFLHLLTKSKRKIAFLNLSNKVELKKWKSEKEKLRPKQILESQAPRNLSIAKKAGVIIFLGAAVHGKKYKYLRATYKIMYEENCYLLPHPSCLSRKDKRDAWLEHWAKPGSLLDCIDDPKLFQEKSVNKPDKIA